MNVEARVICRPCSTKLIDEMEARPDWRAPVITRLDVARTMQFCGSQTGGEE